MRVRVVDHEGKLLASGEAKTWAQEREAFTRHGITASTRPPTTFVAPARSGSCIVTLDVAQPMPLWYGGTYMQRGLDFSLPSGLHNVWGQGNDFDTDAFRIHPEDLVALLAGMSPLGPGDEGLK